MLRWRRPRTPAPPAAARTLTREQVLAWRTFVSEVNSLLSNNPGVPGIHAYAQRIRDAVIQRRMTVEEFLSKDPAPWRH